MTVAQSKVYTLKEAAEILKLNRQTLYNNIRKGNLHVSKVGKEYRITEEQLQDIIKNGYGNKKK